MRLRMVFAAALAVAGCGGSSYDDGGGTPVNCTESSAVETSTVTLAGTSFTPACIKVRRNGTLTFTAADATIHTVTTDGGQAVQFGSGNLNLGDQFSVPPSALAAVGTIRIHCAIHVAMRMRATIIVHE